MTASTKHLGPRAVELRRSGLSLRLAGRRLGMSHSTVAKRVRELAPELIGNVRARETLWLREPAR